MASKKQRLRLRRPFDCDYMSPESELGRRLVEAAKVPPEDAVKFLVAVSKSVDAYLRREAKRKEPGEIRHEITKLAVASFELLNGGSIEGGTQIADLWDRLSPPARRAIEARAVNCQVPTRDDLTSADDHRRTRAFRLIHALCVTGGTFGGSPQMLRYSGPQVKRGKPKSDAELDLCTHLAIDYAEATGRTPCRYHRGSNRGPFVDFVREVLNSLGATTTNAEKLVRRYSERWSESRKVHAARLYRRLRQHVEMRCGVW